MRLPQLRGERFAMANRELTRSSRHSSYLALLLASAIGLGSYVFLVNQEETALTLGVGEVHRSRVIALAPEKWGFFTKSPRDESIIPYLASPTGSWRKAALFPHSEPRNLWGLSKRSRSQGLEVGLLYTQSLESDWTQCEPGASVNLCATDLPEPIDLTNTTPSPTLCGRVLLSREFPAAWAYSRSGGGSPSREIQEVTVLCSDS